jgi:nucleosome binding factor SPN SPT16 subunit
MKHYLITELEASLDDERKIGHEAFSDKIEAVMQESFRKKLKIGTDVSFDSMDWAYPPIIQSGGKYDLRPSASSNK